MVIRDFEEQEKRKKLEGLRQLTERAVSPNDELEAIFAAQKLGLLPSADAATLFLFQGGTRLILT